MIAATAGNLTYHIDTPIPRDGDDGVERTEIDTWETHCKSALHPFDNKVRRLVREESHNLPTTLMLGGK